MGLRAGPLGLRVDLPAVYEVGDGEWHGAWVVYRDAAGGLCRIWRGCYLRWCVWIVGYSEAAARTGIGRLRKGLIPPGELAQNFPQGLKPLVTPAFFGTTEVVP